MPWATEILDAVYNRHIGLNELEYEIVKSPSYQRLNRVRQLGLTTILVYPNADHTRFAHPLGVMHLVGGVTGSKYLNLSSETRQFLRIAAEDHDLGHGPFSHQSEAVFAAVSGKDHEEILPDILKEEQADLLADHGIDYKKVAAVARGELMDYSELIRGHFDLDYLDCLKRDQYFTGARYGVHNFSYLVSVIQFYEDDAGIQRLAIKEKGRVALEHFFEAKSHMFETVYFHHTNRIADKMLTRALEELVLSKYDPKSYVATARRFDDAQMQVALENEGGLTSELMRGILDRKLLKQAKGLYLSKPQVDALDSELFSSLERIREANKIREVETRLADKFGIDEGYILLDIPSPPERDISDESVTSDELCFVMDDGSRKPITEVSSVLKFLKENTWSNWRFGVYVPETHRNNIAVDSVVRILSGY